MNPRDRLTWYEWAAALTAIGFGLLVLVPIVARMY